MKQALAMLTGTNKFVASVWLANFLLQSTVLADHSSLGMSKPRTAAKSVCSGIVQCRLSLDVIALVSKQGSYLMEQTSASTQSA